MFGDLSILDPEEVHDFLVALDQVDGPCWSAIGSLTPVIDAEPCVPWTPSEPLPWPRPDWPAPDPLDPGEVRQRRARRAATARASRARVANRRPRPVRQASAPSAPWVIEAPPITTRWATEPIFDTAVDRGAPWGHVVLGRPCVTPVDTPVCTCGVHRLVWVDSSPGGSIPPQPRDAVGMTVQGLVG